MSDIQRDGFTLLEILLVLAITAVLGVVGAVFNAQFRELKDLDAAISSIAAVVRDAQQKSITQEERDRWGIWLEVRAGTASYLLFKGTSAAVRARYQLPPTLAFDTSGWSDVPPGTCPDDCAAEVTFTPLDGLPSGGTDVILEVHLVNDSASARTITIFANGTISY